MDSLGDHCEFVDFVYLAVLLYVVEELLLIAYLAGMPAVVDHCQVFGLYLEQLSVGVKFVDLVFEGGVVFDILVLHEFGDELKHVFAVDGTVQQFLASVEEGSLLVFQKF